MSYLLAQILVCLLIAGLIGAIIGWLLRGGCSRKLRDCEDEWKMKMGSLESEYNSKLNRTANSTAHAPEVDTKEMQAATLKKHAQHVESQTPTYSYEEELKKKLELAQKAKIEQSQTPTADDTILDSVKAVSAAAPLVQEEAEKIESTPSETIEKTKEAYEKELKEKLQIPQEESSEEREFYLAKVQQILATRNISLSPEKIALYAKHGIDFEEGEHLEDNYSIEMIEGIGPKYAEGFKKMGITTTQELVQTLRQHHDKLDQVAKALKIQPEALSSWISMADLVQLPGVDGQAAELMQTVGIASAKELAITNANSLHSEMIAFNKKSSIVPQVPSADALTLWSKIAKLLNL